MSSRKKLAFFSFLFFFRFIIIIGKVQRSWSKIKGEAFENSSKEKLLRIHLRNEDNGIFAIYYRAN